MAKSITQQKDYKQTDVGIIPTDWEVRKLGELFEITSSKRVFRSEWQTEGIPFYRARELAVLSDRGYIQNELFISKEMYTSFKNVYGVPQISDMLVTGVGTLGKVYVVPGNREFYFKDGNIIWFKISGKVNSDFLKQLYLTRTVIKQIEDASAGTTVGTYTISGAKKTLIPFPSLPEQTAIAAVLSDADALIKSLEKLIAKKRAIKQGVMQELLTGKRRLPGFSGKWEVKRLDKIFSITAGRDLVKESYSLIKDELHPYPIYSNSLENMGLYGYTKMYRYIENCITVTARGTIGFANSRNYNFDAIGRLLVLKPIIETNCFFLSEYINQRISFAIESTGVPQLTAPQISKYFVLFPDPNEQSAIASALSDIDAEIEALERKLIKYKQLKQGMMQVLLTGKIRLHTN